MRLRVGIPRALYYFKYYILWKTFFEEAGIETVLSAQTDKRIMESGIAACVSEACLPVKAYFGHALDLAGHVDMLFVPRYTSVSEKEYICPKFGGLPDMVKNSLSGLPELLSPEINMRSDSRGGWRAARETAKTLGISGKKWSFAYDKAVDSYLSQREGMAQSSFISQNDKINESGKRRLCIMLMGHPYTVYDSYINMNIIRKLNFLGADVLTMESFDGRELREVPNGLPKPLFWNYGTKALCCTQLLIDKKQVDGVVYLTCFGCGIDSFVGYMAERRLRKAGVATTTITLDEHTGEAGLQTRLEAFMDTLGQGGNLS